jgi:plastocyanin
MTRTHLSLIGLTALVVAAAACGSNSSPTSPSTGSPGPSGATITILASGAVSPTQVDITAGQSVTFINQDSRSHEIASDPHPDHNDCPPINALGVISPGQTRNTNALPTVRTCGFHDHQDPTNTSLQGRIVIH